MPLAARVLVPALAAVLVLAAPAARAATPLPDDLGIMAVTDPADAVAYLERARRARALFDAGDHAAAVPVLEELVARYPADGGVWSALGRACYLVGDYPRSAEAYRRAEDIGTTFVAYVTYNLACSQALAGDAEAALASLRRTLAAGFEDRPAIAEDEDLAVLHDHPAWPEVAGLLPADVAAAGRDAGWRYDLAFWVDEVRRLHPDPFARVAERDFLARVADLDARIPRLTDEQVMIELQKLTVLLGDGHSGIRPVPGSRVGLRRLPLQLYAFADGLFVMDAPADRADLVGCEVLAIGDRDVAALWTGVGALVTRDNAMGILDMGPVMLTVTATLRALGALDEGVEDVVLRLRTPDGGTRRVTVASEPMRGAHREIVPPPGVEAPLYLAREDEVFWFDALPGVDHGVYAQFNVVRDGPRATVAEHARRLHEHLAAHPEVDVVVLDLRHNGGGNSFLYPPLVRALVAYEQARPGARLYVLQGRRTFSACQNLVTDLDWWTDAVFAGEPSGSRPNQIGESTWSRLPFSGLRAGISSRFHQQSYPGDDRPWVAPDLPVAVTAADYFAGRDPVLEAVAAAERARR